MVKAEWTGSYPSLCTGEWKLIVDDKDVSHLIPGKLRIRPMATYGVYSDWRFVDWEPVFNQYEEGLHETEWIKFNHDWLSKITDSEDVMAEIYKAIKKEDWRHRSCGGCI